MSMSMSETNTRYERDMKHERAARVVLSIDFGCFDIPLGPVVQKPVNPELT